jgi:hypothetical protein
MATLSNLGLNQTQYSKSKTNNKSMLVQSIRILISYHLNGYKNEAIGEIIGEMLFNSNLFFRDAANHLDANMGMSVNSSMFTSVALLQLIDLHVGSLNDHTTNQHASIGDPSKGKSMLPKQQNLISAWKAANQYISCMLDVHHSPFSRVGELVVWTQNARLDMMLRYLASKRRLLERALK